MDHCVECPVLWGLVYHPVAPPACPSTRLGFECFPTPEIVERVVLAYHVYNVARTAPVPGDLHSEGARERHHCNIYRAAKVLVEHSRAPF
eukprot:2717554-Pyramimonas_sp.AAC.1